MSTGAKRGLFKVFNDALEVCVLVPLAGVKRLRDELAHLDERDRKLCAEHKKIVPPNPSDFCTASSESALRDSAKRISEVSTKAMHLRVFLLELGLGE